MGFSRQEYWSGLPCLPSGDLPDPGIEPASFMSPALQVGSLPLVPPEKPQTHINGGKVTIVGICSPIRSYGRGVGSGKRKIRGESAEQC